MIELKNIDLSNVTLGKEFEKWNEEIDELEEAEKEYTKNKNVENRKNIVKEWLDGVQVEIGILYLKYGITADEIEKIYNEEWVQKLENRPREKVDEN